MRIWNIQLGVLTALLLTTAARADDYAIDAVHSSVTFQISHLGLAWIHGRFNEFGGEFTIDSADPSKSKFTLSIKPETIDSSNSKRDDHLKSPDFFNVKQFPELVFKSKVVKPIEGGLEVTGDLSLHGETKLVTFTLKGGRTAEFPPGVSRTGYSTQLVIKRSDFGVGKPNPALGDEVYVAISIEERKSKLSRTEC
jgi:polyisoprenoid-binding protein YceI